MCPRITLPEILQSALQRRLRSAERPPLDGTAQAIPRKADCVQKRPFWPSDLEIPRPWSTAAPTGSLWFRWTRAPRPWPSHRGLQQPDGWDRWQRHLCVRARGSSWWARAVRSLRICPLEILPPPGSHCAFFGHASTPGANPWVLSDESPGLSCSWISSQTTIIGPAVHPCRLEGSGMGSEGS